MSACRLDDSTGGSRQATQSGSLVEPSDVPAADRRGRTSRSSRGTVACCPSSCAALCSVPHQRHEHARRGGCGREHEGYCKSAQIRPVAAPAGVPRRTRNAVMHSMRGGIEPGRQGHRMHLSRCATPTIRAAPCVNQLSDLTGPDSVPTVIVKGLRAPDEFGNGESTAPDCSAHDAGWRVSRGQCLAIQACGTIRSFRSRFSRFTPILAPESGAVDCRSACA